MWRKKQKEPPINKLPLILITLLSLSGCGTSAITPKAQSPDYPDAWQREGDTGEAKQDWLKDFPDTQVKTLIGEALNQNFALASQAAAVDVAAQNKRIARSARLPRLDLSLRNSRDQSNPFDGVSFETRSVFSITADLSFEIDLWRRLSDAERAAHLNLLSIEADYEDARRVLAANTARQWYNSIEAKQLLGLFQERLANLSESADIIENGYRQGINEALDVFLAQNSVEQEEANVDSQQQLLLENIAQLQRFLARYPDGNMEVSKTLPVIDSTIPVGLPAELITRRADVQSAWLSLLSADAELAVSHKARFPSLALSGRASDTTEEFDDLLQDGVSAWSIVWNLSRPLFDGGRLASLEEQAKA
ncbi:MAG: TolC family protein, partial [Pseudomonadota bacterium]